MPRSDSRIQPARRGPTSLEELAALRPRWRAEGTRVVSTNGVFEIVHAGHARFLEHAKSLGDVLVVGLNSDSSVRRLKGPGRPWVTECQRAEILLSLCAVDYVVVFDEPLPNRFLQLLQPAVHCKASDYSLEGLPEREVVESSGGEVRILPVEHAVSTSSLAGRIIASSGEAVVAERAELSQGLEQISGLEQVLEVANAIRRSAYQSSLAVEEAAHLIATAVVTGHMYFRGGPEDDAFVRYLASEYALRLGARTGGLSSTGAASVAGVGEPGDSLIVLLDGGDVEEVSRSLTAARHRDVVVVALTTAGGAYQSTCADVWIQLPSAESRMRHHVAHSLLRVILDRVTHLRQQVEGV